MFPRSYLPKRVDELLHKGGGHVFLIRNTDLRLFVFRQVKGAEHQVPYRQNTGIVDAIMPWNVFGVMPGVCFRSIHDVIDKAPFQLNIHVGEKAPHVLHGDLEEEIVGGGIADHRKGNVDDGFKDKHFHKVKVPGGAGSKRFLGMVDLVKGPKKVGAVKDVMRQELTEILDHKHDRNLQHGIPAGNINHPERVDPKKSQYLQKYQFGDGADGKQADDVYHHIIKKHIEGVEPESFTA